MGEVRAARGAAKTVMAGAALTTARGDSDVSDPPREGRAEALRVAGGARGVRAARGPRGGADRAPRTERRPPQRP